MGFGVGSENVWRGAVRRGGASAGAGFLSLLVGLRIRRDAPAGDGWGWSPRSGHGAACTCAPRPRTRAPACHRPTPRRDPPPHSALRPVPSPLPGHRPPRLRVRVRFAVLGERGHWTRVLHRPRTGCAFAHRRLCGSAQDHRRSTSACSASHRREGGTAGRDAVYTDAVYRST